MPRADSKSIMDQSPTGISPAGQFVRAGVGDLQVDPQPHHGRFRGQQALIDLVRLLARTAAMEQLASIPPYGTSSE